MKIDIDRQRIYQAKLTRLARSLSQGGRVYTAITYLDATTRIFGWVDDVDYNPLIRQLAKYRPSYD